MKKKRMLTMLLAAAMAFTVAAAPAGYRTVLPETWTVHADGERVEKTYGDWSYYDDTGMVALSGYHGSAVNVTIPSKIDGMTVYRIFPQTFQNNDKVETITIPKTVQIIAGDAFLGCTALRSFTTAADGFYRYSAGMLYYITPDYVDAKYTVSVGDWTSSEMDYRKELVYCTRDNAYITVPEGVGSIGPYAFAGRTKLTHILLPAGIQRIGEHAFDGCTELRGMSMTTGDSGGSAFNIPYGTVVIGSYAFSGCGSIRTVNLPNTVEYIGTSAFQGTSIKSVYIPPSVEIIGFQAFNFDITVFGDPKTTEDGEDTETVAQQYAANNYSKYSSTSGYHGGDFLENVTHDPSNDFDHNYVYTAVVPVTCTTPGSIAGICYCGHTYYQEFPAHGHSFTEPVTVPPTCTEDGYSGMKCLFCDTVYESSGSSGSAILIGDKQIIPALGHSYGTPVYEWSEDHAFCTARSYCVHDDTHIITEMSVATSKKDGDTTVYTATFSNKRFTTQTCRVKDGTVVKETGDVSGDGIFDVLDVIVLQKWLLAVPGTQLADGSAADFYADGRLDGFDLCLMKRALVKRRQLLA